MPGLLRKNRCIQYGLQGPFAVIRKSGRAGECQGNLRARRGEGISIKIENKGLVLFEKKITHVPVQPDGFGAVLGSETEREYAVYASRIEPVNDRAVKTPQGDWVIRFLDRKPARPAVFRLGGSRKRGFPKFYARSLYGEG